MTSRPRISRPLAALVPLLLIGGLTACSDNKNDNADTTSAPVESVALTATDTTAVVDPAPVDTSTDAASLGPSGGVTLADGEAPAERTIIMAGETMTPNELSIKVGETVTFKTGDELHAVIVGDLSGATVNNGLIETFVFTQPGTYPVRDDLTSATATIKVS